VPAQTLGVPLPVSRLPSATSSSSGDRIRIRRVLLATACGSSSGATATAAEAGSSIKVAHVAFGEDLRQLMRLLLLHLLRRMSCCFHYNACQAKMLQAIHSQKKC